MNFQPSVEPYQGPLGSIFITNVGRTRILRSNYGPRESETLLQCFANALRSINTLGYVVQGAMYSPQGDTIDVRIFVETDDELWVERINIHEQ